jgi:cell division protease FtsH
MVYTIARRRENKVEEISYSDFLNMIEPADGIKPIGKIIINPDGKTKKLITIDKEVIEGWFEDAKDKRVKPFKTIVAPLTTDVSGKTSQIQSYICC